MPINGNETVIQQTAKRLLRRVSTDHLFVVTNEDHKFDWVVVRGMSKITNSDSVVILRENESTYVPQGQKHRLEVQCGVYVGEDDIVRVDDIYGRCAS